MIEGVAESRFQRGSARKIGRIGDLVRGQQADRALTMLAFLAKPTKAVVMKTLRSAVANAIAKAGKAKLKEEDLVVTEVRVDTGPMMKRMRPGPRGSGSIYARKLCHVRVKVAARKEVKG